jgi:tRNA pseudouridine55 synthase
MSVLTIYKPIGKTPLDMIKELKKKKEYENTKMSYAGRLDPMAHGVQLIITDELCRQPHQFLNLDKTYEFSICFGIETDTHDILGKITNIKLEQNVYSDNRLIISDILDKFVGKIIQEYPLYSSKRVDGKPLWYYAKNNLPVDIPVHEIHIRTLKYIDVTYIDLHQYLQEIIDKLRMLDQNYDFRQKEIIEGWTTLIQKIPNQTVILLKLRAEVSSGTYIRILVRDICDYLGIIGMTSEIHRTKIGIYEL